MEYPMVQFHSQVQVRELDSLSTGVGSKSKPCTKFFSTTGCPFGESCHFLHYVPGGYNVVAQVMNLALPPLSTKNFAGPHSNSNGSSTPSAKTRLCNKFNAAEGCKFGNKCHFAHGERELGKPVTQSYGHGAMLIPVLWKLLQAVWVIRWSKKMQHCQALHLALVHHLLQSLLFAIFSRPGSVLRDSSSSSLMI